MQPEALDNMQKLFNILVYANLKRIFCLED